MRNERLREAIRASGLAITELGSAVGVDGKTAQRWVYEGRTPHRRTADRVSRRLGVPVDWLWLAISCPGGGSSRHPKDFIRIPLWKPPPSGGGGNGLLRSRAGKGDRRQATGRRPS
jgi:hypothetical protein